MLSPTGSKPAVRALAAGLGDSQQQAAAAVQEGARSPATLQPPCSTLAPCTDSFPDSFPREEAIPLRTLFFMAPRWQLVTRAGRQ